MSNIPTWETPKYIKEVLEIAKCDEFLYKIIYAQFDKSFFHSKIEGNLQRIEWKDQSTLLGKYICEDIKYHNWFRKVDIPYLDFNKQYYYPHLDKTPKLLVNKTIYRDGYGNKFYFFRRQELEMINDAIKKNKKQKQKIKQIQDDNKTKQLKKELKEIHNLIYEFASGTKITKKEFLKNIKKTK